MPKDSLVICLTTVPKEKLGVKIAKMAVTQKLAACVQVLPAMTSVYSWENRVCEEKEFLVLFKTTRAKAKKLFDWLKKEHPYDVPEWLVIDAVKASSAYEKWVIAQVAKASSSSR